MPTNDDKIPGTSIPRDIEPEPNPIEAAAEISQEEVERINAIQDRVMARAKELELAFRATLPAQGSDQEDANAFSMEACAMVVAGGHLAAFGGVRMEPLMEMLQMAYGDAFMVIMKAILGKGGLGPGL